MGESRAEWWTRKRAECALLARAAGVEPAPPATRAELWMEKQRLRAALLARAFTSDPGLTESNFFGDHGRFRYQYQRFNMTYRSPGFFEEVYGVDRLRGPAFGLWGGSGTGTITAALRTLDDEMERPRRLLHPRDCYFETRGVMPLLDRLLPNDDDDHFMDGDLFLFDSITVEDHFPFLQKSLKPLSLILSDTTAYPPDSPLLQRLITRASEERVPLLLLRSHLKLDCLATEYARLGSAVFWMPEKPPLEMVARLRGLRDKLYAELVRAGAMALPTSLWPLHEDPEFHTLNSAWNRSRVAAQARVGAALSGVLPHVKVRAPHHGCFVLFDPRPRGRCRRDLEGLLARFNEAGLPARNIPSFGFDIVALCVIPLETGDHLRISVPDLPDEDLEQLIEILRRYWQEYR
jgi:hypothetical protein